MLNSPIKWGRRIERIMTATFKIIFSTIILGIIAINGDVLMAQQVDSSYTRILKEGEQSYLNGDYEEAIKQFEVAAFGLYNEKNLLAIANIYLSLCYYGLNDIERCEKYLRDTELLLGENSLENIAIHEEAKEDLELLLFHLRPDNTKTPELSGKSASELEQEIRELHGQIKTEPTNAKLYYDLYERCLEVKNFKEAWKTIEKLLKINPREIQGYYLIGVAHYMEGKYDDAEKDFNRFFQHSANVEVEDVLLMKARAYLTITYYKNGEREKSIETIGEAPDMYSIRTVKTLPLDRNDKILLLNILEMFKKKE